jgi:hypothetical protein
MVMPVDKETGHLHKLHTPNSRPSAPKSKHYRDHTQYLNRLEFLARLLESNNGGFELYVRKMAKLPRRTFA